MLKKKWQRKRTMEIRAQEQNVLWAISLFRELHPARGEEKHFTGEHQRMRSGRRTMQSSRISFLIVPWGDRKQFE